MNKFKKLFSKKNNLIISVMALIECIILIGISTFSWIESSSSLKISGDDLGITSGLNHDYIVDNNVKKLVDLSTYFSDTEHFSFARATSRDGKNFFLPIDSTRYRESDTTDYNTSYYNFDFNAVSSVASNSYNFYFNHADIFTFATDTFYDKSGNEVTVSDDDKTAFLNSFRIAITSGTSTYVYSPAGGSFTVGSSINANGSLSTGIQNTRKISSYVYGTGSAALFSVSSTPKVINVKIWCEEKDTNYAALSASAKEALSGAKIDINLQLVNTASDFKKFRLNDYSLISDDDKTNSVFFCYNANTETTADDVYYPMIMVDSTDDCFIWETSDESNSSVATIPEELLNNITSNNAGYFFYGNVVDNNATILCKWNLSSHSATATSYEYNALSATKDSDGNYDGVGYWSDQPIAPVIFVDKTTYSDSTAYNSGAYQLVKEDHLYFSAVNNNLETNTPIKLNYFNDENGERYYKAYVLAQSLNNQSYFIHTKNDYVSDDEVEILWTAARNPSVSGVVPQYTALGYNAIAGVRQLDSVTGVGTWDAVKRINFSSELIDATVVDNKNYRFRVTFNDSNTSKTIYMATDVPNPFIQYAYIPDTVNSVSFECLNSYKIEVTEGTPTSVCATWGNSTIGNSLNEFYATGFGMNAAGLWNLAVFVDGTADNLVDYTLTNSEDVINQDTDEVEKIGTGAALSYYVNGNTSSPVTPVKIDSRRHITGELSGVSSITFNWTAYESNSAYTSAAFSHTLNGYTDGICYITVTEGGAVEVTY